MLGGQAVGWVCFGQTPCTVGTYDIYWIAVAPGMQGKGVGAALMAKAETLIAQQGGRLAVVETSGRAICFLWPISVTLPVKLASMMRMSLPSLTFVAAPAKAGVEALTLRTPLP